MASNREFINNLNLSLTMDLNPIWFPDKLETLGLTKI